MNSSHPTLEPSPSLDFAYRRGPRIALSNFAQNFGLTFNWRKWRLTGRLVSRTLQGLARRPMVRQVEVALGYDCNLSCPHCSRSRLIREGEQPLSVEEYADVYAQLNQLGVVSYAFTGGEPLLHFDRLLDVIRVFEPRSNVISIQSNTLLLNDARAATLKAAGLDVVQASLDEFHTNGHGTINFAKAKKKLDLVRRNGLKMTFTTVVTHANLESSMIREAIDFTRDNGVLLFFNIAVPVGSWTGCSSVRLDERDQIRLRELTLQNPHTRLDFAANFAGFGCPAFKERMYITPYGEVLGCPFLQISGGSLRKGEEVRGIQERALRLACFERYNPTCLAGEDDRFLREYIPLHDEAESLPLDLEQVEDRLA